MNYSELTLHYFETARAAGVLAGPEVYRGAAGSREQGTWVQFDVWLSRGTVRAARFLAFGCPHTIAVSAWVAEHAVGHEVEAALPVNVQLPESVQELSGRFAVPLEKRGRLLIIEDAWRAALASVPRPPRGSDGH
jgi:NifU-like protein involved in Fe-S cluster formation